MSYSRSLLILSLLLPAFAHAQEFGRLCAQGPVPYLEGPALVQIAGNLTAGDFTDIACGDYDADGRDDIVAGSAYGDLLFYRRRDGIFDKPVLMLSAEFSFTSSRQSRLQVSPELVDLNQDGILDLLLGAGGNVYFYSRKGGLQPGKVLRAEDDRPLGQIIGSSHLAPSAEDLDGDGDADIVLGDAEGRVWWVECLSADPLRLAVPVQLAAGEAPLKVGPRARVCIGDWDGDSRYDLLVGDATGQVYFVRGRREGLAPAEPLFRHRTPAQDGVLLTEVCPRLRDVDGDDKTELLLGARSGFVATFVRSPQGPVFTGYLQAREAPIDVGRYAAPTAADWNADGVTDIVCGAEDGLVRLFLGRRDGRFEPGQMVSAVNGPVLADGPAGAYRYSWPRLADLNGDGVSDLVLGGVSGKVEMLLNLGGFRSSGTMRIGGDDIRAPGISAICLSDYDGDGDTDLFVGDLTPPNLVPVADGNKLPRFVLPTGGLAYFENQSPKGPGMPVFLKGVRLAAYVGRRGRAVEDDALDAGVLGPYYLEPLNLTGDTWNFLLGTRAGYYVFSNPKSRLYYPMPTLESTEGIPNPLFPPLYSCTAASLRGAARGLLCGLGEYGFVCYYPPEQVPQLNGGH